MQVADRWWIVDGRMCRAEFSMYGKTISLIDCFL